jgi:hypothetical protein
MPPQVSGGPGTVLNHIIVTTPAAIAQVLSINPPSVSKSKVDTFNLGSTVKTNRPNKLLEYGDCSFHIQWDPAEPTHKLLTTLLAAGTVELWNIVFADEAPTTVPFSAWVQSVAPAEVNTDGNLESDIVLSVQSITWPT